MSNISESSDVISINNTLSKIFQKAINEAYPNVSNPPVIITTSSNAKYGDYQCNSAMPLAQQLSSGKGQSFLNFNLHNIMYIYPLHMYGMFLQEVLRQIHVILLTILCQS